jgi:hypothetical protein
MARSVTLRLALRTQTGTCRGTDGILSGTEIRLRLDFTSFQHGIVGGQGRVQRWRMRVGRAAEALQFILKFESQMAWAGSSLWMHELRNVAEG